MAKILEQKCVGCRLCQKFCSVDAIKYNSETRKCFINTDECVDCYVCMRKQVCPRDAIAPDESMDYYKQFCHVMSDPVENHGVTGVTGRGTEEVKTNDVSGRVRRGRVGFCIDVGRPGVGARFYDVEKIAMAIAAAGVKLEGPETTPLAALMKERDENGNLTGKLFLEERDADGNITGDAAVRDHANDRLLSVIVEGNCAEEDLENVMTALKKVSTEIETVFSLGLIMRIDEDCQNPALKCLDKLGIPRPHRAKINVGLGKPIAEE
ncbi:MAG: 4Fe-4S binding protein [Clostridia bacterium]|nr:4Fe-4S binding protein [Clostridia bacterium]